MVVEFADREWPRNASPITAHGTSPAGSSVPPRGSSRQAQEPPVGQRGQSPVGQHDPNRQGSDPLPRNPGKTPNNSQQEDSSSNIRFNIEEPHLRFQKGEPRMRIRTWAGRKPSLRSPRPKLSAGFSPYPLLTRPGRRRIGVS